MEATTSIEAAPGAIGSAPGKASRIRVPAPDERLVKRIRAGNEAAFATLYERYQGRLLSFCRHMLGSQAEAEDAVQQCFVNAYRDIMRGEKELRVRPWLYRIARNQCLSALRTRRFAAELDAEQLSVRGLSEQVAERADLRDLLRDLGRLPDDQREALVLAELNDNSHAEVAEILGCDREKVKSLVFQARSSLIKSREARALPCSEVQRQLSVLRGGSLRRTQLRRHLGECPACRAFHEDVKRQRAALAVALPVVPSVSLKFGAGGALAAAKASAGAATTGAASSGVTAGSAATLAVKLGASGTVIKGTVAAVAVTAAIGGAAGVEVVKHRGSHQPPAVPARTADPGRGDSVPRSASQRATRGEDRSSSLRRQESRRDNLGAKRSLGNRRGHRGALERRSPGHGRPLEGTRGGARGQGSPSGGRGERIAPKRKPSGHQRPKRLSDKEAALAPHRSRPQGTAPSTGDPAADDEGSELASG